MDSLIEFFKTLSSSQNLVVGSRILFGVGAIMIVLIYFGLHMSDNQEPSPCSPQGYPGRCYQLDPDVCEVIWQKSQKSCKAIIDKLNLPPGRLSGPIQKKCQVAGLDKAFRYNRKSSAECDAMFTDLEDWVKRNEISP